MNKKSALIMAFLFAVQAFASSTAVIPAQFDDENTFAIQETGARSNNTTDTDGDGISDVSDMCPNGTTNWTSNLATDYDSDGCQDSGEDTDDDNDGMNDVTDACPKGALGWTSYSATDHDSDGCQDSGEDTDDDNDGVLDSSDSCPKGELGWTASSSTDADGDGCRDSTEDSDGGSSSGNNTGGNNNTCHASNGPEFNLSLDNSIYHPTDTVNAVFDFFCMDNKAGIYTGVSYWVYGPSGMISSTFYVHNTSTNYYFWDLDNRSNNFSETGWLIPTGSGNMSVGNYYVYAELWDNNTQVDSLQTNFSVSNSSSNGGSTGGNNTNEYVDIVHSGYAWETSNMVEVWDSGTDVYVEFTSGNLVITESYQLIWNLSDSVYNVDVYGSGNFQWNASSTTSQENSTISGLADGVYYFHATLVNQGLHIASDTTMIQMGNNTGGNTTGDSCGNEINAGYLDTNWVWNNVSFNDTFNVIVDADCLFDNGQQYEFKYELYEGGSANSFQDNAGSGQWNSYSKENSWTITWFTPVTDVIVEEGDFVFVVILEAYVNGSWTTLDLHQYPFTVGSSSSNNGNNTGGNNTGGNNTGGGNGNNTGGNNTGGGNGNNTGGGNQTTTGSCMFTNFTAYPQTVYAGEDLTYYWSMTGDISSHVYVSLHSGWGTQYYYSNITDNDGSHTFTLPSQMNPNLDYTIYVESAFSDGRTTVCWKYGAIDVLGVNETAVGNGTSTPTTVDTTPRISMWYGKVNQHNENGTWMTDPDGTAGAGTFVDWGDDGWGDRKLAYCQRFWPSTVDVVLRNSPEEIIFYTQNNDQAFLSTKPVWECVTQESLTPELTGICSFDLALNPMELPVGDTLTLTWTMTGDIPAEVGLAVFSTASGQWNVGVQYHLSEITANDGSFSYSVPSGMNPDRDYYVYVDAELTSDFTTYCWKYGSFDILASNEGALEEVLDNLLNTTDRTPRISMWYGKVNQHNENGTWMTDPDGSAGAGSFAQFGDDGWGDRKMDYCKRFWPNTLAVSALDAEQIVFYTAGNSVAYLTTKPVWECVQDTDGDGFVDSEDLDDDGDGWADLIETACGTDQYDANSIPVDSNANQICDLLEEAGADLTDTANSEGLPALGTIGTMAAIAAGIFASRRKED